MRTVRRRRYRNCSGIPDKYFHRLVRSRKKKIVQKLLAWSTIHSPVFPWRTTNNPYFVLVSELLLRRTRAEQVREVYTQFTRMFPSIHSLATAKESDIGKVIYGLGIVTRSRLIARISRKISNGYSGEIPSDAASLTLALGKNSRYTRNAILCFSFNQDVPIFDSNVKRIFERVFTLNLGNEAHKKESSWELASQLVPRGKSKNYNWALLDLGRMICTPARPKCNDCPISSVCDYASNT
jgi:A/G-specific adenine glycosylase